MPTINIWTTNQQWEPRYRYSFQQKPYEMREAN